MNNGESQVLDDHIECGTLLMVYSYPVLPKHRLVTMFSLIMMCL